MRRVFFMDDNALVLRLYTDLLLSLGYEVQTCSDSLKAMDIAIPFQPDIAFLDIMMPNESGLNIGRQLRAIMADLPIFAMTAMSPDLIEDQLTEFGFTGLLRKPCSTEEIRKLLQSFGGRLR